MTIDLGIGMSRLNKWVTTPRDTDVVSKEALGLAKKFDQLRREHCFLKEEGNSKKAPDWGPLMHGMDSLCYAEPQGQMPMA